MLVQTDQIEQDWQDNTDRLLSFLGSVDATLLNRSPQPAAWTVLETMEHVLALEQALGFVFRGRKLAPGRDAAQHIDRIRRVFADDATKLRAGGPLIPQGNFHEKDEAVAAFRENRDQLISYARQAGWDQLCYDFDHALFGRLTVREWIYFCIFHGDRHLRQMERTVGLR